MRIKKKDLIFIHKFIWSYIHIEIETYKDRNINLPLNFNIYRMKNKAISLLLEYEIINNTMYNYLSINNCCILCLIFSYSENGCLDCPLEDCTFSYSKYQMARIGSLSAIRDIYYSIDKALIPEYIEIPEE